MSVIKKSKEEIDTTKLVQDYHNEIKASLKKNASLTLDKLHELHIQIADALIQPLTAKVHRRSALHDLLEQNFKLYRERGFMNLNWRDQTEREVAIGIDLGTVNSVTAVYVNGQVKIIPSLSGEINTPSCVAFTKDGKKVFGKIVQNHQCKDPQTALHDVKRLIGRKMSDDKMSHVLENLQFPMIDDNGLLKICVMDRTYLPEEISALLLMEFKRVAENYLQVPIKKAVITVPAYFNNVQREATIAAGKLADLDVLSILNEPTAAAIAYKLQRLNERARLVLIFDLGGGTFDVAVIHVGEEIEIKNTGGDTLLGGIDFDVKLMEYCIQKFGEKNGMDVRTINSLFGNEDEASRKRKVVLQNQCEVLKRGLSFTESSSVYVANLVNGTDFKVEISRQEFEDLIKDDVERMKQMVDDTVRGANITPSQIDDIVVVGGATRIPKLQEMLKSSFPGRKLNVSIDPYQAVAYGAAMQAALLNGAKIAEDVLTFGGIQDVNSMSFGVEAIINGQHGRFSKVIMKNSKIPAERKDEYVTVFDDQEAVVVRIYQGESDFIKDNFFLGEFKLCGIPPGKAGSLRIQVTMKITKMGIIHVNAICKGTGSSNSKSLTVLKDFQRASPFKGNIGTNQQTKLLAGKNQEIGGISSVEVSDSEKGSTSIFRPKSKITSAHDSTHVDDTAGNYLDDAKQSLHEVKNVTNISTEDRAKSDTGKSQTLCISESNEKSKNRQDGDVGRQQSVIDAVEYNGNFHGIDPIIGEDEVSRVLTVCRSYDCLILKFVELARELDLSPDVVRKVKRYLEQDIGTSSDVLHQILTNWRSKFNHKARVSVLCAVLKKLDLNECADALSQHFKLELNSNANSNIVISELGPQTRNPIGNKIGRITVDESHKLGRGCHGTVVFKGNFQNRDVAVKRVLVDVVEFVDREVNLLKDSDMHPNVIRLFCTERNAQFLYIALELCFATLQDWIESKYVNESVDVSRVLREATKGLAHIHSLRIVHRDVKPANILLAPTIGDGGCNIRAVISDFGLGRKLRTGSDSFSISSGITSGTMGWMAPEIVTYGDVGKLSQSIDTFSLGCVYYYTLRIEHPFGDRIDRQSNIRNKEYKLNLDKVPRLPVEVRETLQVMLSRNPCDRPKLQVILAQKKFWSLITKFKTTDLP